MRQTTSRVISIVGPYSSGKTTLLESLMYVTGKISKKNPNKPGNTEEMSLAQTEYEGNKFNFIDCPGNIEFFQESIQALMISDAAIIVVDPVPEKVLSLTATLKFLDQNKIPHMFFINKMDDTKIHTGTMMDALQQVSDRPLVLMEIPLREGDKIVGYVDLISERAYQFTPSKPSQLVQMPDSVKSRENEARQKMLETLADFDDHLMEELLTDIQPSTDEIIENFRKDVADDLIVPVFFGSSLIDGGVRRLLRALNEEVPYWNHSLSNGTHSPSVRVFKTFYIPHRGKVSLGRVCSGIVTENMILNQIHCGALHKMHGFELEKIKEASVGDIVAFNKIDSYKTGQKLIGEQKNHSSESGNQDPNERIWPAPKSPLFSWALHVGRREDEMKLTQALMKLSEEDPSLTYEQNIVTKELLLWGQGEIHLKVAVEKLKNRYGIEVTHTPPIVDYRETIRRSTEVQGKHKKQTGGHGQFADVHIEIKPLKRNAGFQFSESIVGGAIPRNYIPSVQMGVEEYLENGPLGFKVVDMHVNLFDGSYHKVDSSDLAFRLAAILAMKEGMPKCEPVLLEPINEVHISVPSEFISRAQKLVTGLRGQILGFGAKENWSQWDTVSAQIPQSEMSNLIIELRSLTQGLGFFDSKFAHLQELTGRLADQAVENRKKWRELHK